MKYRFTDGFRKKYKKQTARIQASFKERIKLFEANENEQKLEYHDLIRGEWIGYKSILIYNDNKHIAIIKEEKVGRQIVASFIDIGTKDEFFKKRNEQKKKVKPKRPKVKRLPKKRGS